MAGDLTFFSKKPIECPVCEEKVFQEQMRTGRGRQIAGDLTVELRRNYQPSKQYGAVYPLIYPVLVCHGCYYAALVEDFKATPAGAIDSLQERSEERRDALFDILPALDFAHERGLEEGVASYILATMSYEFFPKDRSPYFKQGLCQLRGAWLAKDLHALHPSENFDYLSAVFYRKARYFYLLAVEGEQTGSQSLAAAGNLGPDLDKNYGFDGLLYLRGLLEYHYGPRSDAAVRTEQLVKAKRIVARIFGMGKASRNKPAAILDHARDLYDQINAELGETNANPEQDAKS